MRRFPYGVSALLSRKFQSMAGGSGSGRRFVAPARPPSMVCCTAAAINPGPAAAVMCAGSVALAAAGSSKVRAGGIGCGKPLAEASARSAIRVAAA